MKITGLLKYCAKKVADIFPQKVEYHHYKYSTSVQISSDMNKILKDLKKTSKSIQNAYPLKEEYQKALR